MLIACFASAGVNFDYWLGIKNQKNAIFSHFCPSVQEFHRHYFDFFLFFWLSWSQEITFYILTMVVAHSCEQEKKWKFWFFFENLKNFQIFQKQSKFSFFLLFTAMCYDHGEDIKSYFLTSRKPKKTKQKSK